MNADPKEEAILFLLVFVIMLVMMFAIISMPIH